MKTRLFSLVASVAVCGMLFFTSCTKENMKDTGMQMSPTATFEKAFTEVNYNLNQCDFAELKPLADALNKNKNSKGAGELLRNFFNSFIPTSENPFQHYGAFGNSDDVLQGAWDIMAYFIDSKSVYGQLKDTLYVRASGSLYSIYGTNGGVIGFDFSEGLSSASLHSFIIKKDGEELLTVSLAVSNTTQITLRNRDYSGRIIGTLQYQDHVFALNCKATNPQDFYNEVVYGRGNQDMIGVTSTVKIENGYYAVSNDIKVMDDLVLLKTNTTNAAKLAVTLAAMTPFINDGTTKRNCDALCNAANDAVELQAVLSGSDLCTIRFASRAVEGKDDTYIPVVLFISPVWDDEALTLQEVMDMMEITWDDVINMLTQGRGGEQA